LDDGLQSISASKRGRLDTWHINREGKRGLTPWKGKTKCGEKQKRTRCVKRGGNKTDFKLVFALRENTENTRGRPSNHRHPHQNRFLGGGGKKSNKRS